MHVCIFILSPTLTNNQSRSKSLFGWHGNLRVINTRTMIYLSDTGNVSDIAGKIIIGSCIKTSR